MAEYTLKNIFLSASVPSAERNPVYYETADLIAIRDAVRALAATVLPHVRLIWGGHPSITPIIRSVLERMDVEVKDHVTLYQSEFFRKLFPVDNCCAEDICITDIIPKDTVEETRNASLKEMRECMLGKHPYTAGIFIGGMEGVEEEFEFFKQYHPDAFCILIASTGGAALKLFESKEKSDAMVLPDGFDRQRLVNDFDYWSLFRELFEESIINVSK